MMSLVAAYSDSESENEEKATPSVPSDKEEQQVEQHLQKDNDVEEEDDANFEIEDEDDWQTRTKKEEPIGEIFTNLPAPSQTTFSLTEEVEDEFLKKKVTKEDSLFKKEQALLKKEEEEKKEKNSSNFLSKFTKGGKKKNQPVKISIPTLADIGADSDSDNEEGKEKPEKIITNKKASALFSMLPKPKNSVTVGNNKNRVFVKETNRALVPHTLTKKKEEPLESLPKKAPLVADVDDDTDEDDDDNVSTNFFSFQDTSSNSKKNTLSDDKNIKLDPVKDASPVLSVTPAVEIVTKPETSIKQPSLKKDNSKETSSKPISEKNKKDNSFFANLFKSKTSSTSNVSKNVAQEQKQNIESVESKTISENSRVSMGAPITAPLVEKPTPQTSYGVTAPYGSHATLNQREEVTTGVTAPYGSYGGDTNTGVTAPYGSYSSGYQQDGESSQRFFAYSHETPAGQGNFQQQQQQQQPIDYYNQPNEDTPIDKDALQALQGRKRRREEINLIDVNAQDLQTDSEEYLRNLTVDSGYKPQQAKGSGPSGQQKKKHQITYLAFQAKEREFELRQSWADSRAGKKQTQSRYGF